jgi:preprotein translocase subunit SecG
MLRMALMIVQVISSLAIIGLVLLQRGKGADAGAGFGAGASGTVFGARGARTALSRATAIFAAIFMLNSLALAYMGSRATVEQPKTIFDEAGETAPAVPAPATQVPAIPESPVPAPASDAAESGSGAPPSQ